MKVKTQLFYAFTALAVLVAIVATMTCFQLNALSTRFGNFERGLYLRSKLVAAVQVDVERRAVAARNLVLADTDADRRAASDAIAKAHAAVQSQLTRLEEEAKNGPDTNDQTRALVGAIRAVENKYGPVALAIAKLGETGHRDAAIDKINRECVPLLAALDDAVAAYETVVSQRSGDAVGLRQQRKQQVDRLDMRMAGRRGRLHGVAEGFLALGRQLVAVHLSGGPPRCRWRATVHFSQRARS